MATVGTAAVGWLPKSMNPMAIQDGFTALSTCLPHRAGCNLKLFWGLQPGGCRQSHPKHHTLMVQPHCFYSTRGSKSAISIWDRACKWIPLVASLLWQDSWIGIIYDWEWWWKQWRDPYNFVIDASIFKRRVYHHWNQDIPISAAWSDGVGFWVWNLG